MLALCDRISYRVDPDSAFPTYYSGEVVIRTTDGRTLRHREQVNRGADSRPLDADEIVAKFRDNAGDDAGAGEGRARAGCDHGARRGLDTGAGGAAAKLRLMGAGATQAVTLARIANLGVRR